VAGTLKTGIAAAQRIASTVQGWASAGQRLVNDATSLVNYVQSLSGDFGRLFGQGTVRSSSTATSVQSLIAQGALARTSVRQASATMSSSAVALASASGTTVNESRSTAALQTFSGSVLALPLVMASVAPTPADGIRLVGSLRTAAASTTAHGAMVPAGAPGVTLTSSQAVVVLSSASAALLRRGCVIAQAQLSAQYQPVSRDDAQAVLSVVLASIDAEIAIAGDMGEDDVYNSLRAMRTAVVQDLSGRAASAASVATVSMAAALPAPVLAQRLYRDATRADELVQVADPIHPAFMPMTFQALAR
jgi:prophage DNA circulation protein